MELVQKERIPVPLSQSGRARRARQRSYNRRKRQRQKAVCRHFPAARMQRNILRVNTKRDIARNGHLTRVLIIVPVEDTSLMRSTTLAQYGSELLTTAITNVVTTSGTDGWFSIDSR
ncbi:hypothetical protein EVAR_75448_1 [Eumeta japonica]|uniref:Uncharacterized protein n=1 Tax=Eumeta variegata TaxID=151549 RepID=A0A4C1TLD2_EUMVA|nr:hypothetical protein EVAR_75448_1 [Eumeta japonica]